MWRNVHQNQRNSSLEGSLAVLDARGITSLRHTGTDGLYWVRSLIAAVPVPGNGVYCFDCHTHLPEVLLPWRAKGNTPLPGMRIRIGSLSHALMVNYPLR